MSGQLIKKLDAYPEKKRKKKKGRHMHYRADSTLVRYSTATTAFPDLYRIIAPLGEVMRLSGNLHFFRESSFEISFSQEHH